MTRLRVADIGCGAGLMCERLAARGAQVVGVDPVARNIAVAQLHAADGRLNIDYRVGAPDVALRDDETFDVLLISTINRTPRSFVTAIVGAEYVFRVLPRGTHRWAQFVRPVELEQAALACGLVQQDLRGMGCLPVAHCAGWTRSVSVNYIASFGKASV